MSDFCEVRDVFRVLHPNDVGYTRFDRNVKTRVDRIYINENITPITYKTRPLVNSDHLAVVALLRFGETEKGGYWRLNTSRVKNNDVVTELKKKGNCKLQKFKCFN